MDHVIERVCTTAEREILAPHAERLREAVRVLDMAASALEPRMRSEGLRFDPDRYAWVRLAEPEPEEE